MEIQVEWKFTPTTNLKSSLGGPLVVQSSHSENYELIGVVSTSGRKCTTKWRTSGFQRVTIHLQWIHRITRWSRKCPR